MRGMEFLLIALVVILLFGADAIPKLAKSLGQAKKEFEKGMKDGEKKAGEKEEEAKKLEENKPEEKKEGPK